MRIIAVLVSLGLLAACSRPPSETQRRELLVAAAADLVKSLPEIGREFEAKSGIKVVFSFGASGILAQQISGGAPFDAFFSADRRYIDQLIQSGHLDAGWRRTYAQGRLVVWSKSLAITRLEDLDRPEVRRISVANPGYAPYGRAARQALERAGLWDKLAPKLVVAETIRHALEMAESGNADAALTALSLMDKAGGHLWIVPETLHEPLLQDVAVAAHSAHRQQAEAFVKFLAGPEARRVLEKYGFLLVAPASCRHVSKPPGRRRYMAQTTTEFPGHGTTFVLPRSLPA